MSKQSRQDGLSRRQFLPRAAAVAAAGAAGIAGYELPRRHGSKDKAPANPSDPQSIAAPAGALSDQVRTFVSRPDLRPPAVRVTSVDRDGAADGGPRFIFSAPTSYFATGPAQPGLMIVDRRGRLVYFRQVAHGQPFDFNVQSYRGRPVLTSWHGAVRSAHGFGVGELTDGSYRRRRRVRAGDGLMTDLHELTLTSAGTALITAYGSVPADLSRFGGPRNGHVFTGHAQEIDLATGKVVFDWNSLDHVALQESYKKPPSAHSGSGFDYFHINSIAETEDGNLLICARNTCAIYKIDRSTGRVIWRLGGKRSDFDVAGGARFFWQHHARMHGPHTMTVFDNGGPKKEKQSRALLLTIDHRARRVDLARAYVHPAGFLAVTKGSMQRLPDGRVFVGWGDQPYFSEFAPHGALLLHGEFPFGIRSYRAFVGDWIGRPAEPPRIVSRHNPAGGYVVYASWNGATEIDRWTVLAGADKSSLDPVGSQPWTGFETAIAVNSTGPHFAAVALDRDGKVLGRSDVV